MSPAATPDSQVSSVVVRYSLSGFSERWTIAEEPVPESALHDTCVELLRDLVTAWIARTRRDAVAYRNMAVRVRQDRPQVGFDPDVCLVEPAPPDADALESLQLWTERHTVPRLVVEVVSRNHPYKDYAIIPDKCAAAGVSELVVYDPLLAGPTARGGPYRLQVWQRVEGGAFSRVHAGDGPARSIVLDAFWFTTGSIAGNALRAGCPTGEAARLRIADDPAGTSLWLTAEEAERAAHEAERAAHEAERATKEAALRRIAELEAELARRR